MAKKHIVAMAVVVGGAWAAISLGLIKIGRSFQTEKKEQ